MPGRAMAERKCYSRMGIWKNTRIRTTRKKQLYRGILSSLLYGCERTLVVTSPARL